MDLLNKHWLYLDKVLKEMNITAFNMKKHLT